MSTQNKPGTYRKGESVRYARSASTAVALTFEGYVRTGDLPGDVSESPAPTGAQPEAVDPGTPAPTPSTIFGRPAVPTDPEV